MAKPDLLTLIECPVCGLDLEFSRPRHELKCVGCNQIYEMYDGIPLFTSPPSNLVPSEKIIRGPDIGTPWRKANWRFLEEQLARMPKDALVLDFGSGRGDFTEILSGYPLIALDIYPYPEVDIVCDLTTTNPFREASFDVVVLMNVMEHILDTRSLLVALSRILKPGGHLIVAIPFMVKIHQEPIDYVRYTHYALQSLAETYHLEIISLQGYYDPVFFLEEGIGNIRNAFLPEVRGSKRYLARLLTSIIQFQANCLQRLIGSGSLKSPSEVRSKAPTGYHVVYRKPITSMVENGN